MYEKKNLTYILTALEAIEKCFIYTDGIESSDEFLDRNNQMNFNACQILLLVIGEESKKIEENLKHEYTDIPWRLISSLRNRIAHDYRSIDPYISFDIIKNYLPELKEVLIDMTRKVPFERQLLEKALNTSYYKNIRYLLEP
ncbi:MAG: HepT-like ribonuclease domain-containing protein [Bacteroidota bacterium]